MDAATFRQTFPEFADTVEYPGAQIAFWIATGSKFLNAERFADIYDFALQLYTAHHLTIAKRNQLSAQAGGAPGTLNGPVASKTVDKVSVSYDTSAVTLADAGFWNATGYGVQFFQLVRMFGAGGIQL
jgi:hypothetical protein